MLPDPESQSKSSQACSSGIASKIARARQPASQSFRYVDRETWRARLSPIWPVPPPSPQKPCPAGNQTWENPSTERNPVRRRESRIIAQKNNLCPNLGSSNIGKVLWEFSQNLPNTRLTGQDPVSSLRGQVPPQARPVAAPLNWRSRRLVLRSLPEPQRLRSR